MVNSCKMSFHRTGRRNTKIYKGKDTCIRALDRIMRSMRKEKRQWWAFPISSILLMHLPTQSKLSLCKSSPFFFLGASFLAAFLRLHFFLPVTCHTLLLTSASNAVFNADRLFTILLTSTESTIDMCWQYCWRADNTVDIYWSYRWSLLTFADLLLLIMLLTDTHNLNHSGLLTRFQKIYIT